MMRNNDGKSKEFKPMTQPTKDGFGPLGLIWVECPNSVGAAGIVRALADQARVHTGSTAPEVVPSSIILCASGQEDLSQALGRYRGLNSDAAPPILIFGSHLDLPLAREALRAGASGFIHAGMTPDQLIRAVKVAIKG